MAQNKFPFAYKDYSIEEWLVLLATEGLTGPERAQLIAAFTEKKNDKNPKDEYTFNALYRVVFDANTGNNLDARDMQYSNPELFKIVYKIFANYIAKNPQEKLVHLAKLSLIDDDLFWTFKRVLTKYKENPEFALINSVEFLLQARMIGRNIQEWPAFITQYPVSTEISLPKNSDRYKEKYLKYKAKYLNLKTNILSSNTMNF